MTVQSGSHREMTGKCAVIGGGGLTVKGYVEGESVG